MPDRVRDKFEVPIKRGKAELGSSGVVESPPLGSGPAGDGGSQNANDGPDNHCNPDEEYIKRA
jgi:hypothetical protein